MIPDTLEAFIRHYGYLAVLAGTFLEGETILVLAGFLAHGGYLGLPGVWLAAFAGAFCSDQLCFYLGRSRGAAFIRRRPAWRAKSRRIFDLLHRHQVWVILGFRFLYGFRIVTPLVIGASRVASSRFLPLNALGAALWAVSLGTLGYLIGHSIEMAMGEIKRYEMRVLIGIVVIGALVWVVCLCRRAVKGADGASD